MHGLTLYTVFVVVKSGLHSGDDNSWILVYAGLVGWLSVYMVGRKAKTKLKSAKEKTLNIVIQRSENK
jgi:hypothetical protein